MLMICLVVTAFKPSLFTINQALDIQRLFSFLGHINIYYSYSYNYKAAGQVLVKIEARKPETRTRTAKIPTRINYY